jgi:hypothetical protein
MICALLGCMALGSVRRQKRSSASLFEQRKRAAEEARRSAQEKHSNGSHAEDEQIEFTTIQQQEIFPLVAFKSGALEII